MQQHYERLGVTVLSSLDDIKTSYRKLAKEYHPDINPDSDPELFRAIKEAYDWLIENHKVVAKEDLKDAEFLDVICEVPVVRVGPNEYYGLIKTGIPKISDRNYLFSIQGVIINGMPYPVKPSFLITKDMVLPYIYEYAEVVVFTVYHRQMCKFTFEVQNIEQIALESA